VTDHPFFFTWSSQRNAAPQEITGGEGAHFRTRDGAEWLDFASLSYQANLGHGNRRVIEAIKRQADQLLLTTPSGMYPAKTELARKLLEKAPAGFSKVFFTLGGAEATENALKIARMVTGRHKLVSRYRSYHGASMGALSLSGDYRRPPLEPGLVGVVHVLDCFESRLPGGARVIEGGGSAEALGRTLALEGKGTVAAVFVEPVPGANGVLVPPAGYWDEVRAACDREGALLVADCVLDGFGRLGTYYGFEGLGTAAPDLITLSKGLTGGYAPLGAVLVHERVARHFDEHVLYAGLTFYGHPLGVAAGLEAMAIYDDEGLVARAAALGERLAASIAAMQDRHASTIVRSRCLGLLAGVELHVDDARWSRLERALAERRLMAHPNKRIRTLIVSPPLVIAEGELDDGLGRLEAALVASA
jgi:taurine--2-oxoglutarate transaminase